MSLRPGVLYSYKNDAVPPACSRSLWWLHKSKKIWFRLDEKLRVLAMEPASHDLGRRKRYRGDLIRFPKEKRTSLEANSILWGQNLANGWGRGSEGTNDFLHLWTCWSVFQPARWNWGCPSFEEGSAVLEARQRADVAISLGFHVPDHHAGGVLQLLMFMACELPWLRADRRSRWRGRRRPDRSMFHSPPAPTLERNH
jgi:hypothetical protein